jgi:hypothetical protein
MPVTPIHRDDRFQGMLLSSLEHLAVSIPGRWNEILVSNAWGGGQTVQDRA